MATVSIDVDVDVEEVLDQLSERELNALVECRQRRPIAREDRFLDLSSWEVDHLKAAVAADDGRRVVDILRPLISRAA